MNFIEKLSYYGATGKERARRKKERMQLQQLLWLYYQLAYGVEA